MIKDLETAKEIMQILLQCGADLNRSVTVASQSCCEEELKAYKMGVGKVMGELHLELINPLIDTHPEVAPSELGMRRPD